MSFRVVAERVGAAAGVAMFLAACGGPAATGPAGGSGQAAATAAAAPASALARPAAASGAASPVAKQGAAPSLNLSFSATTASQSPAAIAQELGLYQKYGLGKTELKFIASGSLSVTALLSGDIDAQITGGDAIVGARVKGSPGIMIGAFKNNLTGTIMARPGIDSMKQVKTMGTSRIGSNTHYMALQVLKREGLDPKGVTFVQTGSNANNVAALTTGQIDAAGMVPPDDLTAKAQGAHAIVDVTAMKIPYPAATIATTETKLNQNPQAMRSLMQALAAAMKIYFDEPNTAIPIIKKMTQLEDNATVQAAYDSEKKVMERELTPRLEAIQALLEEQAQTEPAAKNFKPEQMVDDRIQKELVASGFFKNP